MDSSLIPNHSVRSHEGRSPTAELQRESDRLKLLLEITNTLVLKFGASRSAPREIGKHPARYALRRRGCIPAGFGALPISPSCFGLPRS